MARSTSKKSSRTNKSKRNFSIVDWLSKNRVWLFVLAFAIAGTYYYVTTFASPKLPVYSDDIVTGYINLTPVVVSKDANGNLAYEMYPATTYVQVDGTVVCDTGGSTGTVTTGTLSRGEVKKLHKEMYDTDVTDLADEIGFGAKDAFVSYEGIVVGGETEAKGTAVYGNTALPTSFIKAKDRLARACEKATRTQNRDQISSPREPKLKKSNNKKTAFSGLNELLFPKTSACCNGGVEDKGFESAHYKSINEWRKANGKTTLPHNSCMGDKATIWSDKMAFAGSISHSPNLAADIGACHPTWNKGGENVGVGYDNAGLMAAFKGSPSHNANMLATDWKEIGVGAVKKSDGRIFVTQRYVRY